MIISPFTPLFFINRRADGIDSEYTQTFAKTDRILLQVICTPDEDVKGRVNDLLNCNVLYEIDFNKWDINAETKLVFATITLNDGLYSVTVDGIGTSEPFHVCSDPHELDKTTLIQYSMKNNQQRKDAVFFIDKMQYFFDFRVHGGFKDRNWTFGVESEQFVTQFADIYQLYGLESTQKTFTMGESKGVPVWFGEMLNRILVCTHVYFDGIKYTRKEASVPQLNVQMEGVNSFVFEQILQQSVNLDPVIENNNHIAMRRILNDAYRELPDNKNRIIF